MIYDESLNPGILDYLGFAFDGNSVKLREKACLNIIAELTKSSFK